MKKGTAVFGMLVLFAAGFGLGYVMRGVSVKGGAIEGAGDKVEAAEAPAAAKPGKLNAAQADKASPRYRVQPLDQTAPAKGPKDAPVTIVEVSDFQCPYCSRGANVIDQVVKQYGKQVRVLWHNNPLGFHKEAMPAAKAALAANKQGKFWEYHDILFANQKQIKGATTETWEGFAQQAGLDVAKFKQDLQANDSAFESQIKREQSQAARFGARGTPGFFINGRLLSGAQPLPKFQELIDLEIGEAKRLRTKGIPASQIYAELTKQGLTLAEQKARPPRPREDPAAIYKVPVGDSPSQGPKDALVTMVVFSEFQCPYCSRIEPTFKQIKEKYAKDVKIVWKDNPLPFHKQAKPAAQAARAAGAQGKFWQYHDKLFEQQKSLKEATSETFVGFAKEIGLNVSKFQKDLGSGQWDSKIDADAKLAQGIGARGTPNSYVNGRKMTGAQPFDRFAKVIDEEIAKAKALIAKGTPRSKVYEELTKDGSTRQVMLPLKMKVEVGQAPTKGPRDAKVTIIEFSDFQCPFCSRGAATITQVIKEYGDKVQVAFKQHPLPFHKDAFLAAEATLAAHEQGKFWEYHDVLWQNQKALQRPELEKYAQQLGLNMSKFNAALDSRKFKAQIDAEIAESEKLGASGTPAFFINGIYLKGAKPFEEFKVVIDQELSGKGPKPAAARGPAPVGKVLPRAANAPKMLRVAPNTLKKKAQ